MRIHSTALGSRNSGGESGERGGGRGTGRGGEMGRGGGLISYFISGVAPFEAPERKLNLAKEK